jgi:glycosyltransferase involved in cell wall biosynthesis
MSEPIHVLQMVDSLSIGGAEALVYDLSRKLVSSGFRVSVCYLDPGPWADKLTELGIRVVQLPWRRRVDLELVARMISEIRKDPPQIVHTHLFKSDFHGRLAARIASVPVVVSTLHTCSGWARNPALGMAYGLSTNLADRIIAVAEEVREYSLHYFRVPSSRIVTIPNGVDVERYADKPDAGRSLRMEFGIAQDAPLIGIVARLEPPKDHATFLRAAALIKKAVPIARFLVVGDGELCYSLQDLAAELELGQSVIFTGRRSDIPEILSALDIMVLSSIYEGLPMALLEGMAAARPFVSTMVGGVTGVIVDELTGLLVPPSDPEAIASACLRLMANPDLRHRMGQAGLARVKEKYSLDKMFSEIRELYESLLARKGIL